MVLLFVGSFDLLECKTLRNIKRLIKKNKAIFLKYFHLLNDATLKIWKNSIFLSISLFHFFLKRSLLILALTSIFTSDIQAQWSIIDEPIAGENTNDFSGASIDLSADGKTVAIGAIANDGSGNIADTKQLNMPLSTLRTGFYFVNIEGYGWKKTVKIIKQ